MNTRNSTLARAVVFYVAAALCCTAIAGTNDGLSELDAIGDAVDAKFLPSSGMFWKPDESGTGIAFEVIDGLVFGAYYNYNPDGSQAYQVFSGVPVVNDWAAWGDTGVMASMEATVATTEGGICLECSVPDPYETNVLPDKMHLTWYSPRRVLIEYKGTSRLMTPSREIAPGSTVADQMLRGAWRQFEVRSTDTFFPGKKFEHKGVVIRLEPRTDDEKWYFNLDTTTGERVGPYWVNLPDDDQVQYKWVCKDPLTHTGNPSDDADRCEDIYPNGLSEPGRLGNPNEIVWQDPNTGEFFGIPVFNSTSPNPECPDTQEVINGREVTRVCVDDYRTVYAYYSLDKDTMVRRMWTIATALRSDETFTRRIDRLGGPDQFMQRMPLDDDIHPQESWK